MSTPDSAMIRFFWRKAEFCPCAACARLIVRLDVDFGSLLPEIDAERRLTVRLEAPIGHWILGHSIKWDARKWWSCVPRATTMKANKIVRGWVARARAHILGMTGGEILAAIEGYKSIVVSIDNAGAVVK